MEGFFFFFGHVSLGCMVGGGGNHATRLVELQDVIFDWCLQNLWVFKYS